MAQRMSSPDGGEVLSVQDEVGAQILGSLGWNTESGGSRQKSTRSSSSEGTEQSSPPQSALSDSSESSGESGRKRGPGRPRKHPVQEEDE